MRLLTIIFTFISFGLIAQTGSINFSVGRSKVTDTATVTMPSGYGGMRFKNQASQAKWQFTNDGTNWYRLIGGNISNNYVPKFNSTTGMLANSQIFDNGTEVGIGTASPTSGNKAHIFGNLLVANTGVNAERWIDVQGGGAANNFGLKLNGRKAVYTTTSGPTVTYFADNDTESMFLQSGNLTLGRTGENAIRYMNIQGGGAANNFGIQLNGRYSMWANTATAPTRLSIGFNGTEAIGITSGNLTDVQGTFAIRGGSPGSGKVLTSDADGDATWTTQVSGTSGQVAFFNGTNSVTGVANHTFSSGSTPSTTLGYQVGSTGNQTATYTVSGYDGSSNATIQLQTSGSSLIAMGGTSNTIRSSGSGADLTIETLGGDDIILNPDDDIDIQADNANFGNTISIRGGSPGSGKVLVSDADGDATWETVASAIGVSSGSWTPTRTNSTNVSSTTINPCQYLRVNSVITGSCYLDVTPTVSATITSFELSLPGGFTLSNAYNLAGAGALPYETAITIAGNAANETISVAFTSPSSSSIPMTVHFTATIAIP